MKKLTYYLLLAAWLPFVSYGQKVTSTTATASTGTASLAVDGNTNTRWESAFSDPQWITVDLGAEYNVSKVVILWEAANAKDYTLEGSNDNSTWNVIQTLQNMPGGNRIDTIKNINATYRYIKINGTSRNLNYGYSIWEIEVYQVSAPVLSGLVVTPAIAQVLAGDAINFTATGIDQNNDPYPLSQPTVWTVNDTNATIDSTGRFVAHKPGFYIVTATNGAFSKQANIDVLPKEKNISNRAKAYASSGNASLAIDNNAGTRWESAFSDPQWIMFAFDTIHRIYGFRIEWEAANAKDYVIEGSIDSTTWFPILQRTNMPTGSRIDVAYDLDNNTDCKYIRLTGTARNLNYGYSIWEFKTYERDKIAPLITWNNPGAITYGTPLDSTQLNASANIAGTFAYYPTYGTILPAGIHTLYTRFYPNDPLTYSQAYDSVVLTVNKAVPAIQWNQPDTIVYGTLLSSLQLNANVTNGVNGQFIYSPAEATKLSAGKHYLKATFIPYDTINYLAVTDSVAIFVKKATPSIVWEKPANMIYGSPISTAQLSAIVEGFDGTLTYNVAIGDILNAGVHTLLVTFNPDDSSNVLPASKSVELLITKATPSINWDKPKTLTYGTTLVHWPISTNIPGNVTYSFSLDTILPVGKYMFVATFVPSDTANYLAVSDTANFTIVKAIPSLQWSNPQDITYGTPITATQLNAVCNDVAGDIEYSVSVDTILPAGIHELKARFIPYDTLNYDIVEKMIKLKVLKAIPVVTWNNPDTIEEGTPLSEVQLNATANVPGTFIYDPTAGTVLTAGTHTLAVSFVPNDSSNYSSVNVEVVIYISPRTIIASEKAAYISIFPNPCSSYIKITTTTTGKQLRIFDVNGRMIKVLVLANQENLIDLSDFSGGIYYFKVEGSVFKVIKR